jgi:hypothetical protein
VILKLTITAAALAGVTCLAIPVVTGDSYPANGCGDVAVILDTIRTVESGGRYDAPKNTGGASGAYQYLDRTWNNFGGYLSAYLAPPEVQDQRAAADVQAILATYGDVAYVPIIWYWPSAARDPRQLDIIPLPGAGNTLTVRDYQQRWMTNYNTKIAAGHTACSTPAASTGYALPLDHDVIAANPPMLRGRHHDYPAVDLLVPVGSRVYALRAGTVARIVNWPGNCWTAGICPETCGIGLSIDGDDGARYIYCHGERLNDIHVGEHVDAGQLIMWTGDTGRSGAPHLHLEIRVNGQQRCPQTLIQALFENSGPPAATALQAGGCDLPTS